MDNSISAEMERILARLKELGRNDFPQYRSYRRPDGTWVDREAVPEYQEQEKLIQQWRQLQALERRLAPHPSHLLVSLRLEQLYNSLLDEPQPMDPTLLWHIAVSVSRNAPASIS